MMERLRQVALLAVVGQVVLLGSAWLLPLASEYGLVGDNISELVLGRYGWVQTLAFVISGLGIIGLAYAIYRLTSGARGSILGPLLIGIYGFGAVIVAIFPTDRIDSRADVYSQSVFGWIHSLTAAVCLLCVVIGMFVLTWTFSRLARWRSLVVWSALLAGAALALLFVQMEGPWVGLMQRLLITAIGGWLLLVATRVRTIASTRKPVPGEVGEIDHSAS
jgi:Protein of unknown function (DUF998)